MNLVVPPIAPGLPIVDPDTGVLTNVGLRLILSLIERTGGTPGASVSDAMTMGGDAMHALFADVADAPVPDLSPLLYAETVDSTDTSGLLPLYADPVETVPDMGEPVLLALALGDVA